MSFPTERGGHVQTFPFIEESPTGPPRTHQSYINDAKEAVKNQSLVHAHNIMYIASNINFNIAGKWYQRTTLVSILTLLMRVSPDYICIHQLIIIVLICV